MTSKIVEYKKASLLDIKAMETLVQPEVDSGVILMRSSDEIATNIRSYMLAFYKEKLVGFVALHLHTIVLAEVRSLVIDSSFRGKSIGSELVKHCIGEAKKLGIKEVLSLTYEKLFFERLGFNEIAKESLPEHKIWADCIKCKHFPICNEVSLIKIIS
jgi:amino-acid N-acetyltransferase